VIYQLLKAIDTHTQLYLRSGDVWHLHKAQALRVYVSELKTWIHSEEGM
jgi:hypothetical protein